MLYYKYNRLTLKNLLRKRGKPHGINYCFVVGWHGAIRIKSVARKRISHVRNDSNPLLNGLDKNFLFLSLFASEAPPSEGLF